MDIGNNFKEIFWSLVYWIPCQHRTFSQDSGQASEGRLTHTFRYILQYVGPVAQSV